MTSSVITTRHEDTCPDCGNHLHQHDKERVQHQNGTYSYDYNCP